MVEVGRKEGRASPPKPILGSKISHPEKITPTQNVGVAGCGGGLGRKGERAHQSRCPAQRGHTWKGSESHVEMANPQGGGSGVTDVPSGTGTGLGANGLDMNRSDSEPLG